MRVKLAQAGEGGGARPSPFITLHFISSKNMYSVGKTLEPFAILSFETISSQQD